jgi:hypothetical protein
MLTGIHFLLTYTCTFECDHCFLHCSPRSQGTFAIGQVERTLDEAVKTGTVEWIFYEGGEPFLYFPLLVESIRQARKRGFKTGVVTNGYGAISEKDAELWLRPLADAGLSYLSVSNDPFHYGDETVNPAVHASVVAARLGIETAAICIQSPKVDPSSASGGEKGQPIIGEGARLRGRAAEKLTGELPLRPWEELMECPYENLASPSRVHVDPFGHVHICQGISMGNMWKRPLAGMVAGYRSEAHPVCGPLLQGGPAELARALGVAHEAGYVDECHFCYSLRKAVLGRFPDYLAPEQVYGTC